MTFFLDNTNPPRFAVILRALDFDVRHLLEVDDFPEKGKTPDLVWIPYVGKQRWFVVTGDHNILTDEDERQAFEDANLIAFFMPRKYTKWGLWQQLGLLIKAWPGIERQAARAKPRDCYEVQGNGKVSLFVPKPI